jgi:hypothetical protein
VAGALREEGEGIVADYSTPTKTNAFRTLAAQTSATIQETESGSSASLHELHQDHMHPTDEQGKNKLKIQ